MTVKPLDILPTQDFLKPGTIRYIFECIKTNKLDDLPPTPILFQNKDGELLAIDGHNLIAVKLFLGEDIEVHVAESRHDGLKGDSKKSADRNDDLLNKYSEVLDLRADAVRSGALTFQDLIDRNKELFLNIW